MLQKKKIIITGGHGFIGSHLAPKLRARGHAVSFFDTTEGNDVRERNLVFKDIRGCDIVYHLAGTLGTSELNEQAHETTRVNVLGTVNVLDAARKANARVVVASKPNPWLNIYSITKEAAEKLALMYASLFGMDVRVAKLFNVYGPRQKDVRVQKAVPTFILRALKDEPIPVFGTGRQTADFIFVTDAVEALVRLGQVDKAKGTVVEVGTGKETTVDTLARLIIRLTGSRSKIEHVSMRPGEPLNAHIVANPSRMRTLLEFTPTVGLEEGLKETISWYRRYARV